MYYGFEFLFFLGLYLFVQCFLAPLLGWIIARSVGWGGKVRKLCALLGFLLVFVPIWPKHLTAWLVYNQWKPGCGSHIYKPFEQWEAENPGVLPTLEKTEKLWPEQKRLQGAYPNQYIEHRGVRCGLVREYRSNGKQRLGWYSGGKGYLGYRASKSLDVWYDIEKQEVLADRMSARLTHYWDFLGPDLAPPWRYYGPSGSPDNKGVDGYIDFFLKKYKE